MDKIPIAIAEDNPFALQAIKRKLASSEEIVVRQVAPNGKKLLEQIGESSVSLVLMDIEMPEMDGIRATALLQERHPQIKVLVLTTFDDDDKIFEAIRHGASGYLLKDEDGVRLHQAIKEVLSGGAPMSPSIALKVLGMVRAAGRVPDSAPSDTYSLTKRELEILEQLKNGLTYQEIADNLFISFGTVRKHVDNIYGKLHVNNRIQALKKLGIQ